jgi:hypothetical protein
MVYLTIKCWNSGGSSDGCKEQHDDGLDFHGCDLLKREMVLSD